MHTSPILRQACLLLTLLFLSFNTSAQTTPAWQSAHMVGSSSFARYVGDAVVDATGNTYEVGGFEGTLVAGSTTLSSQGSPDAYLAKYTPAGTLAWIKHLSSTGYESVDNVALDAAGNVYICGEFTQTLALSNSLLLEGGAGNLTKGFVARYSPLGIPEWAQQTSAASSSFLGAGDIGLDAAGNVYTTYLTDNLTIGTTTVSMPANNRGVFLARFSATTGSLQSIVPAFHHITPANRSTFFLPKLAVAATGEVYIVNTFFHPAVFDNITLTSRGKTDALVAKYDAQGRFEWVQQVGGADSDVVNEAVVDAAGNLYAVGSFVGPTTLNSTTLPSFGGADGYLLKYSFQGVLQWAQTSGGPRADGWLSVALDATGNPYVTGSFNNVAQFGSTTLASAGERDVAVAAYTREGQIRWAQAAGGLDTDIGTDINIDASGGVCVLGTFTSTCAFGPFSLSTSDPVGTFLARFPTIPLATKVVRPLTLSFYPNPVSGTLHVPGIPVGRQVQFVDALGRISHTASVAPNATVSMQGIAPGFYVVRATDAQGRPVTGRLVVE